MKKIEINKRDLLVLLIIAALVVGGCLYLFIKSYNEYKFSNQMESLYIKNKDKIFAIDKIVMYSSANAEDYSEGKIMQDLNICQYTDIAVYIDNMVDIKELAKEAAAMNASTVNTNDEASMKIKEHTIKELYIDNIQINPSSTRGIRTLTYKSANNFGKFKSSKITEDTGNEEQSNEETQNNDQTLENDVNNIEQPKRINFKILSTNVENDGNDYSEPTFYSDCSNPITLNYMNKNIVTNYKVTNQDTKIKFDGSILQSVGVVLEDLECYVSFDIHMKNNLDQTFTCSVETNIPLKSESRSIYNGYMYVMQDKLQDTFKFFKR